MGKGNAKAVKASVAYKALIRIGAIYDLEGALKELPPEERLKERQSSIRPLVEEYFAWIKDVFKQGLVLPKSETAKGLAYSINQEEYLKVFLTDGEVPIDDSASERALHHRPQELGDDQYRSRSRGKCDHLQHHGSSQSKRIKRVLLHQVSAGTIGHTH